MKQFVIDLYLGDWDIDNQNQISRKRLYTRKFATNKQFDEIEDKFYPILGEGLRVSSNSNENFAYFNINIFWERDLSDFEQYLSEFEEIFDKIDIIPKFKNTEYNHFLQLDTGDIELNEEEIKEISKILNDENVKFKIQRGQEIYEKGASSYWVTYLIAMTAGLTVQVLMRIYDYLKKREKLYSKRDISQIEIIDKMHQKLVIEYNIKPGELFLSRFFNNRDDKIIELIYKTNDKEFTIETSKNGEILNLKVNEYIR